MRIKSLTIYCSSSKNLESDFYNLANDLGIFLANKSVKIKQAVQAKKGIKYCQSSFETFSSIGRICYAYNPMLAFE